jgi:hypothetical protein
MLTILNDPAGITGRQRFPWNLEASLQDNIAAAMPDGGGECQLRINGVTVDPLTDPRMDEPPELGDFVTITRRPGTGIEVYLYVALAAITIYTLATMPKAPSDTNQAGKQSPNNALTAQTNLVRVYQAIPDAYGLRRLWPDLIQPSVVEYIDNVKYVTEWLCLSRGKGTVTSVQYADTPIADIDGSSHRVFEPAALPSPYPENNDTTLTDVLEVFQSPEVNGQEIVYAGSVVPPADQSIERPGSILQVGNALQILITTLFLPTGSNPLASVSNVRIEVTDYGPGFTAGMEWTPVVFPLTGYTSDDHGTYFNFNSTGLTYAFLLSQAKFRLTFMSVLTNNILGPFILPRECSRIQWNTVFLRGLNGTAEILATWNKVDASGAAIPGTTGTKALTYTNTTADELFFTEWAYPTAGFGRYAITFQRTNPNSDTTVAKLEALYAANLYATKTLPGVTVIRVTTQATIQATGFSERKFNARWQRHVRTLSSDTLTPSRNFARTIAHLWALAGQSMAELDTGTLAGINAEFGEDSELLRYDGSFDDADVSLGERMQQAASHARCNLWRDGTKWTVTREQARSTPELQFDYRNLSASGESGISYAAHLPGSSDGIEVEYVDPVTLAEKAYVRLSVAGGVTIAGRSENPLKVQLPGCTTELQARNRAHLEARRLLFQRVRVQDTALPDASVLGAGALVRWVDPNDFAGDDGLQAGEVLSIAGDVITTSEPLDWKGEIVGRVLLTGEDGRYLGSPISCTPVTGGLQLATVPAGLFVRDAARQCGSRYAFAVGLTNAEVEAAGLYVVEELRPGADRSVSIALSNYDVRLFEKDNFPLNQL